MEEENINSEREDARAEIFTDPDTGEETTFEAALATRYQRLSLLSLDLAEEAGEAVRGFAALSRYPDRKKKRGGPDIFDRGMIAMSKAIWAHTQIERLRLGGGHTGNLSSTDALHAMGKELSALWTFPDNPEEPEQKTELSPNSAVDIGGLENLGIWQDEISTIKESSKSDLQADNIHLEGDKYYGEEKFVDEGQVKVPKMAYECEREDQPPKESIYPHHKVDCERGDKQTGEKKDECPSSVFPGTHSIRPPPYYWLLTKGWVA